MVEPSSLADTVTPPSFSPVAEAIAPLNSWSAACAEKPVITRAALANRMLRMLVMTSFSPLRLEDGPVSARGWSGSGHCPDVRNDGVDLVVFQVMLEGRHARRAVDDVLTHDGVVAVGGGLVQRRTVGSGIEGRRQVADAAGLRQQLAAVTLHVVEIVACLLGGCAVRPKNNKTGDG